MYYESDCYPQCVVGVDIGGTKISFSIANERNILLRTQTPTPLVGDINTVPRHLILTIASSLGKLGIESGNRVAIGICSPGPFVIVDGMKEVATPNICGAAFNLVQSLPNSWTSIPFEAVLGSEFENVQIENDCIAALKAELAFGAARGSKNAVFATWSTGIGFAACIDGNILRGKNGNAGHAGHQFVSEGDREQCGCGNVGDLESIISGRAMASRFGSGAELFSLIASGRDMQASDYLNRAIQLFSRACFNVATTLDSEVIVLGGRVFLSNSDFLLPRISKDFHSYSPGITDGVRIVPAELATLSGDIGAMLLVTPDAWIDSWKESNPWMNFTRDV